MKSFSFSHLPQITTQRDLIIEKQLSRRIMKYTIWLSLLCAQLQFFIIQGWRTFSQCTLVQMYFSILFRFLWAFRRYANQLFRFKFEHFMAFWKIKFSTKKSKFLNCWIFITLKNVRVPKSNFLLRIKVGMKKGGGLWSQNCFYLGTLTFLAYAW